jgi:methionine-rich copper-binding protein CopC
MSRLLSRAAASILSAVLLVGTCEPAAAASKQTSIVVESSPAPKAELTVSEITIDIHFTTKIDRSHSNLKLLLPNGRQLDLVSLSSAPPDHLSARASALTPGDYTLKWQALPVGKKLVKGEIPFTVK